MENLLKNWNIRRILYLAGGLFFIFTAINDQVWWISIFGVYFVSMAIFQWGCAKGSCSANFKEDLEKQPSDR